MLSYKILLYGAAKLLCISYQKFTPQMQGWLLQNCAGAYMHERYPQHRMHALGFKKAEDCLAFEKEFA